MLNRIKIFVLITIIKDINLSKILKKDKNIITRKTIVEHIAQEMFQRNYLDLSIDDLSNFIASVYNVFNTVAQNVYNLMDDLNKTNFDNLGYIEWNKFEDWNILKDIIDEKLIYYTDASRGVISLPLFPSPKNTILVGRDLHDTHAHHNASFPVFPYTWVKMMNSVTNPFKLKHIHSSNNSSEKHITMNVWKARAIRIYTYGKVYRLNTFPKGLLLKLIKIDNLDDFILLGYQEKIKKSMLHLVSFDRKTVKFTYKKFNLKIKVDYFLRTDTHSINDAFLGEEFVTKHISHSLTKITNNNDLLIYHTYLQIKCNFRTELIQTVFDPGFTLFQSKQRNKSIYFEDNIKDKMFRNTLVQEYEKGFSGLQSREVRLTPSSYLESHLKISYPSNVKTVLHFIKSDTLSLHYDYGIKDQLVSYQKKVIAIAEKTHTSYDKLAELGRVGYEGIDAASSEKNCPPYSFSPVFEAYRYKIDNNKLGYTFHVGEDFSSILNGLYNIYSGLNSLGLRKGDRLGHCLALGVDAYNYLEQHNFNDSQSNQEMLDSLFFIYDYAMLFCPSALLVNKLETEVRSLIDYIYGTYTFGEYREFIELRKIDFQHFKANYSWLTINNRSYFINANNIINNSSKKSQELNQLFHENSKSIKRGRERKVISYVGLTLEIASLLTDIQESLLHSIKSDGLVIESNPTSNLKIGPFNSIMELPYKKFYEEGVPFSINTDDSGVFNTNLYQEFLILQKHLELNGLTIPQVDRVINKVLKTNKSSRF